MAALVIRVIAAIGFAFCVGNFGSCDKTYSTLGGVVSLPVWMWVSNLTVLFGTELNPDIERARELDEGREDAATRLQLQLRQEPNGRKPWNDSNRSSRPPPDRTEP